MMQGKIILALLGLCLSLLACLGTYSYGLSVGEGLEKGRWETREAGRVANTATVAIQHAGNVVTQVTQDNEIERKTNEAYETAVGKLASAEADNRRLVRLNGGLRITAEACSRYLDSTSGTEAASTGSSIGTDPGTIALPPQVDADLQDSADEADRLLERFRALRQWCFDQGFCRLSIPNTPEPAS